MWKLLLLMANIACPLDAIFMHGLQRAVIITGHPSEVERQFQLVREIDQPECAGQRIWTLRVRRSLPSDLARRLDELSDHNRQWPAGITIVKIVPDDPDHLLIIVGNETGYRHLLGMRLDGDPSP